MQSSLVVAAISQMSSVLLVGVGNLGRALLAFRGFEKRGFRIVAAFDNDPAKIGGIIPGRRPFDVRPTAAMGAMIEAEGIRRARARAAAADIKLAIFDLQAAPDFDPATRRLLDGDSLAVLNKSDLVPDPERKYLDGCPALAVSAKTGAGIAALEARLAEEVAARLKAGAGEAPPLTRTRHRRALEDCVAALERAGGAARPELVAEDLRLAARALGRIAGRVDVEDLLDAIFREFCIGK